MAGTCVASLLFARLRSLGGFLAIDYFVADVALGVLVDQGLIESPSGLRFTFPGEPMTKLPQNRGALVMSVSRSDDAARANRHAVQNDRAHAGSGARLDGATVQRHRMPDGDIIAENQGHRRADVQHRAVLNIRARADANVVHIAAHHRHADAGVLANTTSADDDGRGVDIVGCRDLGTLAR